MDRSKYGNRLVSSINDDTKSMHKSQGTDNYRSILNFIKNYKNKKVL